MQKVLFLFLFFSLSIANAQILDDSTKLIYGPSTVSFFKAEELIENTYKSYAPDTLMHDFYKTTKQTIDIEDLGVMGTSSKELYNFGPKTATTEVGFNANLLYAPKPEDFKFFKTRSPYTDLNYTQSSKGTARLGFLHSQNITERLNVTLDVTRLTTSKQIPDNNQTSSFSREDNLVKLWNMSFSGNYFSKDSSYQVLAAYYHFNKNQGEQGGIYRPELLSISPDSLSSDYGQTYHSKFSEALSGERWNNIYLLQQFRIKNGFQLFHIANLKRQKYFYADANLQENALSDVYQLDDILELDSLHQRTYFNVIENSVGVKGRLNKFDYRLYGKLRLYNYYIESDSNSIDGKTLKPEFLAGGQLAYYFNNNENYLRANGELGIGAKASSNATAQYKVGALLKIKGIEFYYKSVLSPPSILATNFVSSLGSWTNTDFKNEGLNELKVRAPLQFKKFTIVPEFQTSILDNYIYFDTDFTAKQNSKLINVSIIKAQINYSSPKWLLENKFNYVLNNSQENLLRMPKFSWNGLVDYKFTYAKVLDIHVGIEGYYKSSYLADAYQPLTQTFYLQNDFNTWGNMFFDAYTSFNINRVRLALKFVNVSQGLITDKLKIFNNGYYTSPYYLGQQRAFLLKVNWPFFD